MSKKEREGMSKRQEFREKRRRTEQRNRWITIGVIVLVALVIAFFLIYPQVKPVAGVLPATPVARAQVDRNNEGNPNALVKLEVFSDYQCPYCKNWWETTEAQVEDAYVKPGKVLFTYRSAGNWVSRNSGSGGTESQDSAMAAYCAADQNKYWQMHDALFVNNLDVEEQGAFSTKRLQAIAQNIGLDMTAYNSCMSGNKYLDQATQDFNDAQAAGITGTPFFVISYTVNGQPKTDTIDGAQAFSVFQQKLDAALAAAGAK
ncbi:MAG TPA: thioredoxin domain-containing protein [Anaerolineales bacterium]|nr:thioredoxin domain-containing protein [Anaerolineales bacterium]